MECLWTSGGALETGSRPTDDLVGVWLMQVKQNQIQHVKSDLKIFNSYLEKHDL